MMRLILLSILALFFTSCGTFKSWQKLPTSKADERVIYVASLGWHTGIVLPAEALEKKLGFLKRDFDGARYYEIGWGDKGFYEAKTITTSISLRAMFWPSESVLHVVALDREPEKVFPASDLVKLRISSKGLDDLIEKMRGDFKKGFSNKITKTRDGIYGNSGFYKGVGSYFVLYTCNSWTASVLDSAGVPISNFFVLRAPTVMGQAKTAAKEYPSLIKFKND